MMKRIVTIGGGSGVSTILSGLRGEKGRTDIEITSIVSMSDHGGSSGRLRDSFGSLPPGDLRKNLIALSPHSWAKDVFDFRWGKSYQVSKLAGHVFGNLAILSAVKEAGSWLAGLRAIEDLLNCQGSVFPSSLEQSELVAELDSGREIFGEGEIENFIYESEKSNSEKIVNVSLHPVPKLLDEAKEKILTADKIIIGPGSVFTSLTAVLLVEGIKEALGEAKGKLIYVCNLCNNRESENWSTSDFVNHFESLIGRVFDLVLVNAEPELKIHNVDVIENDLAPSKKVVGMDFIDYSLLPSMAHNPTKVADICLRL